MSIWSLHNDRESIEVHHSFDNEQKISKQMIDDRIEYHWGFVHIELNGRQQNNIQLCIVRKYFVYVNWDECKN